MILMDVPLKGASKKRIKHVQINSKVKSEIFLQTSLVDEFFF
jgi:hypothetical protein